MSTIPNGLRADHMRARMEDKASILHVGGLYVGGLASVTYVNDEDDPSADITAYETIELYPTINDIGLPLVSNGAGAIPSYRQIGASSLVNGTITKDKLSNGTIVNTGNTKKVLNIHEDPNNSDILVIEFYDI